MTSEKVYSKGMEKVKNVCGGGGGGFCGCLWIIGWLFTIGFLGLGFWKGLLAIILWPYYIGVAYSFLAPLM